ncbi:MAG: BrnT family toxin [Alphaproteobacteria bacterium]
MRIAFDPAKDATNHAKHGVPLGAAARLDWGRVLAKLDSRADYGEPRWIGYGPIGRRLYCVVFVDRGSTRRIISARSDQVQTPSVTPAKAGVQTLLDSRFRGNDEVNTRFDLTGSRSSLRKANNREIDRYEAQIGSTDEG